MKIIKKGTQKPEADRFIYFHNRTKQTGINSKTNINHPPDIEILRALKMEIGGQGL